MHVYIYVWYNMYVYVYEMPTTIYINTKKKVYSMYGKFSLDFFYLFFFFCVDE